MSGDISLHNLVDLSIGTPHVGAVNFTALHTLLHAVLDHLQIQTVSIKWTREKEEKEEDQDRVGQTVTAAAAAAAPNPPREEDGSGARYQSLSLVQDPLQEIQDLKDSRDRLKEEVEELHSTLEKSLSLVQDPLQEIQDLKDSRDRLKEEVEELHSTLEKSLSLVQDPLQEIQDLKDSRDRLKEEVEELHSTLEKMKPALLADRTSRVEECCHRVDRLEAATRSLRETVGRCPGPEALEDLVTWEVMQSALLSERENLHKEFSAGAKGPMTDPPTPPNAAPRDPGRPWPPPGPPPTPPPHQRPPPGDEVAADAGVAPRARVASAAAERYPETLEALRVVGRLSDRHDDLEERVETLEAELARLDALASCAGTTDPPEDNVLEQMNHLRSTVERLSGDQEKPDLLVERKVTTPGKGGEESRETREGTPDSERAVGSQPIRAQITQLRRVVQKLEEDMRQVRGHEEAHATDLQAQLDDLRGTLEDMMASSSSSSSSLLCQNLQERDAQGERDTQSQTDTQRHGDPQGQGQGQGRGRGGGLGPGRGQAGALSTPSRRVETLQEAFSTMRRQQDECSEAESDVQDSIARVQGECERLRNATQNLLENHEENQTHIQQLYKSLEALEEKKADKLLLETEILIKADKCALESKVSRVQLDAATEQLSAMFHDLLTKVTGQEQGWHDAIEHLSSEMEGKLNRMELDSLKKQLEDRWQSIHRKLKSQLAPEQEDAAGITKQLVARFHCISCARPVDMNTPGPHVVTVPSAPGFPSHRSSRPFTVYELEQVRQHCRSQTLGCSRRRPEVFRSAVDMFRMCGRGEGVRGWPSPAELSPSQGPVPGLCPPRLPPLHAPPRTAPRPPRRTELERVPETTDYGYVTSMSRSCGGSHTVTQPSRRSARLQHIPHFYQTDTDTAAVPPLKLHPGEVDILGLDGQIYKGRLNVAKTQPRTADPPRLPTLSPRESTCKSSDSRVQRSQSQRSGASAPGPGSGPPTRPQSTKTVRSRSGSGGSAADDLRSLAENSGELRYALVTELHVDLRPPEGEGPGTSL